MNEIIAALVGKCWHEWEQVTVCRWKCKYCDKKVFNSFGQYPTRPRLSYHDSQGRRTYEVIDWAAKEMPATWNRYGIYCGNEVREMQGINIVKAMRYALSLSNFLRYLKTHLDEWAMIKGTEIINPKYQKAVKLLKEWEGKEWQE